MVTHMETLRLPLSKTAKVVKELPEFGDRFDNDCGVIAYACLAGLRYAEAADKLMKLAIFDPEVGCYTARLMNHVRLEVAEHGARVRHHMNHPKTLQEYLSVRPEWSGMVAVTVRGDWYSTHALPVFKGMVINALSEQDITIEKVARSLKVW